MFLLYRVLESKHINIISVIKFSIETQNQPIAIFMKKKKQFEFKK
jgi:hypothetical protein